jgi:hypothetical protein
MRLLNVYLGDTGIVSYHLQAAVTQQRLQREYVPTGSQIGDCSGMAETVRMSVFYLRTGSDTLDDVPQARWIKRTAFTDHK